MLFHDGTSNRSFVAARSLLALLPLSLLGAGCGGSFDESGSDESVGVTESALGTSHLNTVGASETAVTTLGPNSILTMNFNADDPSFVSFFPIFGYDTRVIQRNASLMGFTSYDRFAGTIVASGRVRPPSGWAVIWGDPSIVRNRSNGNLVYMANLAIPNGKFPSAGFIEGPVNPSTAECGAYIGGACIARSSNNGTSFTVAASDCVRRITSSCPNGTFYDGSDMESSPEGRVYAAFNDVTRSRIDVYMATTPTGSFSRISELGIASGLHPRLKYGPDGLYLLFMSSGGSLTLARYNGGSSFTGTWTNIVVPGSAGVSNGIADVRFSDRAVRLGPEYDFDIGFGDSGENQIRIVYTLRNSSGKHFIKAVRCSTGTITCAEPGAWNTASTAGDQFQPSIGFGFNAFTGAPTWHISFHDRRNFPTGNRVELWGGEIKNPPGSSSMTVSRLETSQVPCPDFRCTTAAGSPFQCPSGTTPNTFGGYWGDYDRMRGHLNLMYRGFSDSSHGTCSRQMFHSSPLWASIRLWNFGLP